MNLRSLRFAPFVAAGALAACSGGAPSSATLPQTPLFQSLERTNAAAHASVFVAVASLNEILEFPGGVANPKPQVAIRKGISNPIDLAVDGSGNLYVLNAGYGSHSTITEYPPQATSPSFTLTIPRLSGPYAHMAVGPTGTIFTTDNEQGNIDVYLPGSTKPNETLTNPGFNGPPYGLGSMAVDATNQLYVEAFGGSCCGTAIAVYRPYQEEYSWLKFSGSLGGPITFDGSGGTIVAGTMTKSPFIRDIFPHRYTQFAAPKAGFMSYDATDSMLYTTYGTVSIIDYNTKQVVGTLPNVYDATGVAVSPASF
jgi:hypothetical protein